MEQDMRTPQELLAVVRRRWRLLLLVTLLGVIVAVGLSSLQAERYTAEADVLVQSGIQLNEPGRAMDPEQVATQAEIVVSDAVARRVIDDLGLDTNSSDLVDDVTASPADGTSTVTITATAGTRDEAADIANGFAEGYIALASLRASAAQTAISDSYLAQLTLVSSELARARAELPDATGAERRDIQAEIESLLSRRGELQSSLRLSDDPTSVVSGLEVLHPAVPPQEASEPRPLRAGMLGGVIGLLLGLVLAFVRDRRDDVLREGRSSSGALSDLPVLGRIPVQGNANRGKIVSLAEPRSLVAEAYRGLNTNIRFLLAAGGPHASDADSAARLGRIVMVTSASPGEGKTSVAGNLAVAAARVGMRVILVDADLRDPAAETYFGVDAPRGLADLLRESGPLSEHLFDVGVPNLSLLPSGSIPPNPTDLLASSRCARLWQDLRQIADLVVVDTPPLLGVIDAVEVAGHADATILVARDRMSHANQVQGARTRLHQIGGRVSGMVINGVPPKRAAFIYGYGLRAEGL